MGTELVPLLIGFILTLAVYSYVVGDNPLYRLAIHMLVGVSAAYAVIVVLRQVMLPLIIQIQAEPTSGALFWLLPLLLALFLLTKRLPLVGWLSQTTLAFLVGVGAAVALVGAVRGTLLPQAGVLSSPPPVAGTATLLLMAILTITVLLSFQFTGGSIENDKWKRPLWQRGFFHAGQAILMITFGAIFAAVLSTGILLLSSRITYYVSQILQLIS